MPCCTDNLGDAGRVTAEQHPPCLDVRAGDIELVADQPVGILEDPDHLDIVLDSVTEDVRNDGCIEVSQYREFFGYEGADPDIFEANGIEHPGGGGIEPGCGGSFDRFAGQALGDEASEAVQVNKVGEFEAVTKGSTGSENRIPQAQRANFYAEVNGTSGAHFVRRITRSWSRSAQNLGVVQSPNRHSAR